MSTWDAIVVGSGPNGLAAAITLAEAGARVRVYEAQSTVGGAARSAALTLPGFVHDPGSAVHPLAIASPVFRRLPLARHGLTWVQPPAPFAHPLEGGEAVLLERSLEATAEGLGEDGPAWLRLMGPLVADWERLLEELRHPLRLSRHPLSATRFGLHALQSASGLARSHFRGERARALLAGVAAHSSLPLSFAATCAVALSLTVAGHSGGWPLPQGGAQRISDALLAHLLSLGGSVLTDAPVHALEELPPARVVLLDLTPRQVLRVAGHRLPAGYRRRLERFRYGPGAFKVDWALDGPIPWAAPACARAATVHLGGTLEELEASERAPWQGRVPQRPYVLLVQPTLFDASRAPPGRHTAWAYCHVPNGCEVDMTEAIEAQVERYAPGFRARILARHVMSPAGLMRFNPNLVGGDVNGGAQHLPQLLLRPVARAVPWATPLPGLFLCSSSTPPGGGVHGLCGYFAARAALRARFPAFSRLPQAFLEGPHA